MVLKSLKIIPLACFDYFTTRLTIKNLNVVFFDQVARDGKGVLTFEKRPLVAELKLKMSQIVLFVMFLI